MRRRGKDAWELRVYQGIDPDTRRQRWLTKTVHGTQRFARRALEDLVAEADRARIRAGTLADLLDRWFEAASPGWAAPTVRHTRSVIDCYLKPYLGHLDLGKLTTTDIDDFYGHLLRAGSRSDGPLAAGTVVRVHGVLHRALAQAVRWDWIWLNPASTATPPRVPPPEIRPPNPEQVATLLEWTALHDPPLHCFLRLATSTGARRSQVLALRWGDLDEPHGAIAFTRAWVEGPDGPELRSTKTQRTYRVELDAETLEVLMAHRSEAEARAGMGDGELPSDAFVFSLRPDGSKPWQPNWLTKRFISARWDAGLPRFRLHDLRHFMASQMLAAGIPLVTVAHRLSHARTSTLERLRALRPRRRSPSCRDAGRDHRGRPAAGETAESEGGTEQPFAPWGSW
jgi:integrase